MTTYHRRTRGVILALICCFSLLTSHGATVINYSNGQVRMAPIALTEDGILRVASGAASQTGDITGTGTLVKEGSGSLLLTGTNTFEGKTVVEAGTLRIAGTHGRTSQALLIGTGSASAELVLEGGTLLSSDVTAVDQITMTGGTWTNQKTFTQIKGGFSISGGALSTSEFVADMDGLAFKQEGGTVQMKNALMVGSAEVTGGTWSISENLILGSNQKLSILNHNGGTTNIGGNLIGTNTGIEIGSGRMNINGDAIFVGQGLGLIQLFGGSLHIGGTLAFDGPSKGINLSEASLFAESAIAGLSGGSAETSLVIGTGGLWQVEQTLELGRDGLVSLRLSGGEIRAGESLIGTGSIEGTHQITVVAGTWTNTGDFIIADSGQVSFSIAGGTLSSDKTYLAQSASGVAMGVAVNSNWTTDSVFFLGVAGDASLIQSGGTIAAHDTVLAEQAGSTAYLEIRDSALFQTNTFFEGKGEGTVRFDGATLRITGDSPLLFEGFEPGDIQLGDNGLALDSQTFDVVSAAAFSGSGTLTKLGPGNLVLTGAHQFTGAMVIEAGAVELGNGVNNGSVTSDIINKSQLVFHPGFDMTYNGQISGTGSVVKLGDGTLTLTAMAHTYSGPTTVQQGALRLNGNLGPTDVTVSRMGTLGGTGRIGGNLLVLGTLDPGTSPGTITVGGNLTLGPNSQLRIEAAGSQPGQFDQVNVQGAATLGGILVIELIDGFTPIDGQTFSFLSADGGVSGSFSDIESSFPGALDFELIGEADGSAFTFEVVAVPFTQFMLTPNQTAVAFSLDVERLLNPTGPFQPYFNVWNALPTNQLPGVIEPLIPIQTSTAVPMTVNLAQAGAVRFRSRMRQLRATGPVPLPAEFGAADQLAFLQPQTPQHSLWFEGGGNFADIESSALARHYTLEGGIANVGLDYSVSTVVTLGMSAGYQGAEADLQGDLGTIGLDGGGVTIYGLFESANTGLYFQGMAGLFGNEYHLTRNFLLNGFGFRSARGETSGVQFNTQGSVGWERSWQGWAFGLEAGLHYSGLHIQSFTERGAFPFDVAYASQTGESFQSAINAEFSKIIPLGEHQLMAHVSGGWRHEFLDQDHSLQGGFAAGFGTPFNVTTPSFGKDFAEAGGGVTVWLNDRTSLSGQYDAQLGDGFTAHLLTARLRWLW